MAVSFFALPAPATAQKAAAEKQRRIELTGFAGGYFPLQTNGIELPDGAARDAQRRGTLDYGGRFTYWTTQRVGVEFSAGYSQARFRRAIPGIGVLARSTDLIFGSGKVVLNLTPTSKLLGFQIGGGLGVLHVDKTLADEAKSSTNVGGVGGAAVRLKLSRLLSLRGDAEAYVYRADFGEGKKLVADLLLNGGVSLSF